MINNKSLVWLIILAGATTWGVVEFASSASLVWAGLPRKIHTASSSLPTLFMPSVLTKSQKPDYSDDGRSGNRKGGGSRGNCPEVAIDVTAIMPTSNLGKTVAERPTFWFYVPYFPQGITSGEFVVQDEAYNEFYSTKFTLPKTQGFVSVSLQPSKVPLEINKEYRWYFKLFCSSEKLSVPTMVRGWVQRIPLSPELRNQLDAAKPREDKIYNENLIWYDAIAHLAELRLNNPSNSTLDDAWKNLLGAEGVGLEKLSQEPIVGPVTLSPPLEN